MYGPRDEHADEHHHMRVLIEHLVREGRSEREINVAVRRAQSEGGFATRTRRLSEGKQHLLFGWVETYCLNGSRRGGPFPRERVRSAGKAPVFKKRHDEFAWVHALAPIR